MQEPGEKGCIKPVYATLKVKLFHPDSLRKSTQTWGLCEEHFFNFISQKGEGFFCWYKDKSKEDSPVIAYEILG